MEQPLIARRLAIVPTLRCTLNCKLCCNLMQKFESPRHYPLASLLGDIDRIFDVFDHIEWFQFVGGEIFLYPDMDALYRRAYEYRDRFDKLVLMTNATIAPRSAEVRALQRFGDACEVMISDYGALSHKRGEMVRICQEAGIPVRVKAYHGDTQYYGGWIDNTTFAPFEGGDDELATRVSACAQVRMRNMHCIDGKLHMCSNSGFMSELGVNTPVSSDYVDMRDESMTRAQMRDVVRAFYTGPVAACRICAFKDAENAGRYPAAEQCARKAASEWVTA